MKIKKIIQILLFSLFIVSVFVLIYHSEKEDKLTSIIPENYRKQIRESQECFPKGTFDSLRINHVEMNSDNMTWATRPSITSFFKPKNKRTYLVQNSIHPDMKWIFDSLSNDAQVGILIHEYCHILAYEQMTKSEIIGFAYDYKFDEKFRKKVEQATDSLAKSINSKYWLAWKNSECSVQEFKNSKIAKKYWKKQHTFYLTSNCN